MKIKRKICSLGCDTLDLVLGSGCISLCFLVLSCSYVTQLKAVFFGCMSLDGRFAAAVGKTDNRK